MVELEIPHKFRHFPNLQSQTGQLWFQNGNHQQLQKLPGLEPPLGGVGTRKCDFCWKRLRYIYDRQERCEVCMYLIFFLPGMDHYHNPASRFIAPCADLLKKKSRSDFCRSFFAVVLPSPLGVRSQHLGGGCWVSWVGPSSHGNRKGRAESLPNAMFARLLYHQKNPVNSHCEESIDSSSLALLSAFVPISVALVISEGKFGRLKCSNPPPKHKVFRFHYHQKVIGSLGSSSLTPLAKTFWNGLFFLIPQ